jgi:integrase
MSLSFRAFVRQKAKGSITDGTLDLYDKDRQQLQGMLGSQPLNVTTAQELEDRLKRKWPNLNTQQRKVTSLNWLLQWKGVDYQGRRPVAPPNLKPVVIPDAKYREVLARITDPLERIGTRLAHDTLWSPADLVHVQRNDIDLDGRVPVVGKLRQKTHVLAQAILEKETAEELRAYMGAHPGLTTFIFPGDERFRTPAGREPERMKCGHPCGSHRNRTWLNETLKRHGADFTPRNFRSTGASTWPGDDTKGLMTQGGWSSADTIYKHYKANVLETQMRSFEKMTGRSVKDQDEDDPGLPGYG